MLKQFELPLGVLLFITKLSIDLVAGVDVANLDKEAGSLKYLHLIHRNGETSIEKGYKLDPYSEEKFWEEGMGKLTTQGILNQYRLGQFLGERYSSLLSDRKYNRKQHQIFSTPKEENYLSAMAVSQGMYQKTWSDLLNENMKWIPVNVLEDKTLQLNDVNCPVFEESKKVFKASREYQTLLKKYEEVLEGAANYTGVGDKDSISLTDLPKLWNHFVVESNYKLALQDWAKNVYPKTMQEPVSIAYIVPTWTTQLKKAVTGRFLNLLLDTISRKGNGSEERSITAFSTNDFGIAGVLDVLGVFNSMPVPFDSTIMIELRKLEENNLTVTILYANETITEGKPERKLYLLKMPNCTEVCPLDKFKEQILPYIVEDWEHFCHDGNFTNVNESKPSRGDCDKFGWLQVTIPVAVGAVVILVVVTVCKKMRTKATIVMNNPQKTNRNQMVSDPNESAVTFLTSLGEMPSLFTDPLGGWMTTYDIFTLPPPFIPPPDMMM